MLLFFKDEIECTTTIILDLQLQKYKMITFENVGNNMMIKHDVI